MDTFFQGYLAWAGPNVIAALVSGTLAWWLHNWRRTGRLVPESYATMLMATGGGVLAVVIISAIAAALGIAPVSDGLLGVVAGVVSASVIRE